MPKPAPSNFVIAIVIGITQTIGYGSLYYSFGVLAPFMAQDVGLSLTGVKTALNVERGMALIGKQLAAGRGNSVGKRG